MEQDNGMMLSSTESMRISLEAVRKGTAGLNKHRKNLLDRVPESGDWARFSKDSIMLKDIAYLSAATQHEFALLRGKQEDVLFHGTRNHCYFDNELCNRLLSGQLRLFGHSHPAEFFPMPSNDDRATLKLIRQRKSCLISAVSGKEIEFYSDEFEQENSRIPTRRSEFGNVDL